MTQGCRREKKMANGKAHMDMWNVNKWNGIANIKHILVYIYISLFFQPLLCEFFSLSPACDKQQNTEFKMWITICSFNYIDKKYDGKSSDWIKKKKWMAL